MSRHPGSASTLKVSVCLAAFNGAWFVTRQLESILEQVRAADEVIVVDDASSDDTAAIVAGLGDSRIHLVRRGSNGGVAAAFGHALSLATGDVIFLADQDDLWLPGKLEIVLERIEAGNDLVVHDATVVRDGRVVKPSLFTARRSAPGVLRNIVRNAYKGCCIAFRRTVLPDALPIPNTKLFFPDVWIALTAELSGRRVEFLRQPLIEYTRHDANVTARSTLQAAFLSRIALSFALGRHVVGRALRRMKPTEATHESSPPAHP